MIFSLKIYCRPIPLNGLKTKKQGHIHYRLIIYILNIPQDRIRYMNIPTYWPTDNELARDSFVSTFKKHGISKDNWRQVNTAGEQQCETLSREVKNWNINFPGYGIVFLSKKANGVVVCNTYYGHPTQ